MTKVAIALGSNLGDRNAHLTAALEGISATIGPIVSRSAVYETAPVGGPDQGPYLNAVVVAETSLDPGVVLDRALDIERSRARERSERWAARTLDVDIVLFGNREIDEPGLTVPHPELANRRFVLEPLVEAWPDATLPDGTLVATFLKSVSDQEVRRLSSSHELSARDSVIVFVAVGLVAAALWWLAGFVL